MKKLMQKLMLLFLAAVLSPFAHAAPPAQNTGDSSVLYSAWQASPFAEITEFAPPPRTFGINPYTINHSNFLPDSWENSDLGKWTTLAGIIAAGIYFVAKDDDSTAAAPPDNSNPEPACTGDFVRNSGGVCACPGGMELVSGTTDMCEASCPGDFVRNSGGVCACPMGMELVSGTTDMCETPCTGDTFTVLAGNGVVTARFWIQGGPQSYRIESADGTVIAETGGTVGGISEHTGNVAYIRTGNAGPSRVFIRPLRAGDRIVTTRNSDEGGDHELNGVGDIPSGTVYRIFLVGGSAHIDNVRFGTAVAGGEGVACDAALPTGANQFISGDFILPNPPVFSLRDSWGGLLADSRAVQAGGFLFSGDSDLQNFHVESRWTPRQKGAWSSLAAAGYKRKGSEKTAIVYGKMSAEYAATPHLNFYAQTTIGGVDSEKYEDGKLQGFAYGAFYDWRHNGELHAKIESPPSSAKEKWRIAAAVRIGNPKHYGRFGFFQTLDGKESGFKLHYQGEF
ncbi:MAG: hypothetical protein ACR2P5_04355 [Gammaproteobacteria bacterium]